MEDSADGTVALNNEVKGRDSTSLSGMRVGGIFLDSNLTLELRSLEIATLLLSHFSEGNI